MRMILTPPSRRTRHTGLVSRSSRVAVLIAAVAVLSSACTSTVTGVPLAAGGVINQDKTNDIDPSFIQNTDGGEIDKLAGAVIKDVEKYWRETFPATFDGKQWEDLRGGYYSVDTSNPQSPAPALHRPGLGRGGQRLLLPHRGRDRLGPGRRCCRC